MITPPRSHERVQLQDKTKFNPPYDKRWREVAFAKTKLEHMHLHVKVGDECICTNHLKQIHWMRLHVNQTRTKDYSNRCIGTNSWGAKRRMHLHWKCTLKFRNWFHICVDKCVCICMEQRCLCKTLKHVCVRWPHEFRFPRPFGHVCSIWWSLTGSHVDCTLQWIRLLIAISLCIVLLFANVLDRTVLRMICRIDFYWWGWAGEQNFYLCICGDNWSDAPPILNFFSRAWLHFLGEAPSLRT